MNAVPAGPRADAAAHVGLIGHCPVLTKDQRAELGEILRTLRRDTQGHLILHHGCRPGSDEAAHKIARNIGGWRIHGHPDTDGSPRPAEHLTEEADTLHDGRTQAERDADIASISHVLIVIPRLHDGTRITRPVPPEHSRRGQEVIYLPQRPDHIATGIPADGREDRVPRGNSIYAAPSGLPGLGKRR